jgi:hypothetical protein
VFPFLGVGNVGCRFLLFFFFEKMWDADFVIRWTVDTFL